MSMKSHYKTIIIYKLLFHSGLMLSLSLMEAITCLFASRTGGVTFH